MLESKTDDKQFNKINKQNYLRSRSSIINYYYQKAKLPCMHYNNSSFVNHV